jgi:D-alanyl-D-alanine carboxypeptidase/D-alanyl-D-alanine-endopeptidase (penicillin-binding protein 4)
MLSAVRLAVGLLFAGLVVSVHAAGLPPEFTAALRQAGIPLGRVALQIQPLDESEPLLSHNAEAALNPASVMKLVTSFAALQQLGPNYTWTTEIWADGTLQDGVLDGDLIVRGSGDPSLTLERMWLLQRGLRARGVRTVRGGLVLDARRFELPEVDPGAFDGEPFAPYNAPAGALVANFNAIALRLKPGDAEVAIVPDVALPGVTLTSKLALVETAGCNGWRDALTPGFADAAKAELVVEGRYPRACGEQVWPLAPFAPAATFDFLFRGLWAESGGSLDGPTHAGQAPETLPLLRFESEPLAEALRRLNKYSNNLMAKNLFLTLGAEAYGGPATPEKGARAVRDVLIRQGIATDTLVLENGSGLSRIERASASLLNQLLRAAWRSPWFSEFESTLPVAALDGTLRNRFNGSPATGYAHLKTGTLRDTNALAGIVLTARGRRVAFVMLVNDRNAARAGPAQQALLEWAWADDAR